MELLEVAYASGVRRFRLTGGEPSLRSDVGEIMVATQALGEDVRVAITTNGARLDRIAAVLPALTDPQVFVSVDAIAPIAPPPPGDDTAAPALRIDKWLTPQLLAQIRVVRTLARVRLNYVLTATNAGHLPSLIDIAAAESVDLKIFELLLRDFHYAGDRPRLDVFREQYVSVRSLLPELCARYGDPRPFAGLGGRGIPMMAFHTGTNRIVYFDSLVGSHYGSTCLACPLFPCQEGLYALVLDANGVLHPAGCTNGDLHRRLAVLRRPAVAAAFGELTQEIERSRLLPNVPDHLQDELVLAA